MIIISIDVATLLNPMSKPATTPTTVLNSIPRFLPKYSAHQPPRSPPNIPPIAKMDTVVAHSRSKSSSEGSSPDRSKIVSL